MRGEDAIREALSLSSDRLYTVPGFPITKIGEETGAESVINEKTALEYALGDSLSGRRAGVILKHVGLNACADPLLHTTVQGLRAGLVILVGDDPRAKGSQTGQDSRYYGELAQIPVIEPDRSTCYSGIEEAFAASERFSRIALVRVTPDLLASEVIRSPVPRRESKGIIADYSLSMTERVTSSERVYREIFSWSNNSPLNNWSRDEAGIGPGSGETRIVTVNPMPLRSREVNTIHEIGRPFAWDHRSLSPPHEPPLSGERRRSYKSFCQNCPFKRLMSTIQTANMRVICDAGCSILGINPPYRIGLASYGLGSSIAVAARSTKVALIGDYALLHSGITALIDVYKKGLPLLCIVMKNKCTAMTGGQSAYDIDPYIEWADPIICSSDESETLKKEIMIPTRPRTLVVTGTCPEGCYHEHNEY